MNNLFRGIPFSHEDKIHEHIQESLLLGRRTKGILAWCFLSFLQVFEKGILQKSPISTGRNDRLKPGKLLTDEKDGFQHHCFDIQGAGFVHLPGRFINSPVIVFDNNISFYGIYKYQIIMMENNVNMTLWSLCLIR